MQELISVIIPVYNVAEYLPQCLDSVVGQTYRNLEILLVDDGSTDGSGDICDAYARRDARVKVIHRENGGVSSARNAGLRAATGELIGFVDSDDWCEPDMYEKLALGIRDADAVSCGYVDYPYGEGVPVPKGTRNVPTCGFADAVIAIFERNGYFTTLWNKLFRRERIATAEGPVPLDTSLAFGEDEVWLLRVLGRCDRVAFVPEALYHWRPRAGSVTRFESVSDKQMSLLEAKRIALTLLPRREDVLELAMSRTFNDCYLMKARAYCAGDGARYREIAAALAPMKAAWRRSSDPPLLRKIKVTLMEALMKLHAPRRLVGRLSGFTRYSIFKRA